MTRRLIAVGAAAASIAAVAAPSASAAPAQIAAPGALPLTYDAASYTHGGGEIALFTVNDAVNHNVIASASGADGNPLFSSATINGGTTPVNGTQFLAAGSYSFFCSIHPTTMQASLNVTGSPLARPKVTLTVKSRSLDQVLRTAEVKVKATITGGTGQEQVTVDLRLGKKRIADSQTTTSSSTLKLELTSMGEARLEKRASARVKAEATIDFGDPSFAKGTLK